MPASRTEFLSGVKRRFTEFTLPASGLVVRIQSLTEGEISAIEMAEFERDVMTEELARDEKGRLIKREDAIANSRALMIIATLVDGDGNRLLADGDLEQVNQMDSADSVALEAVIGQHCRALKREDAKKNSATSLKTSPGSGSSGPCVPGPANGMDPTSSPEGSPPS